MAFSKENCEANAIRFNSILFGTDDLRNTTVYRFASSPREFDRQIH